MNAKWDAKGRGAMGLLLSSDLETVKKGAGGEGVEALKTK